MCSSVDSMFQMDTDFTLIVKFGKRGFAKNCSGDYSREELVSFLLSKWNGINKADIFLLYDLLSAGELDLADEGDMGIMLRLLEES